MKILDSKIKKWGYEISLPAPIVASRLVIVRDVGEVVAAAEAKCKVVVCYYDLDTSALLAPLCLYFLVPRHRLSAVTFRPVSLLAEDSWIRFASLFADVFPLRIVVQAFTVNTLTVRMPLTHKVAMVHSNSPFGPPFLRCHSYLIISIQKSQAREVKIKNQHPRCFIDQLL